MSLPLEVFGKVVAIFTAGAGIAIPVAKTLSGSSSVERVKLEKEEDLKNSCLIVLQGGAQGQQDNQDKKLIVCQKNKKPETTEFYFYTESSTFNVSSLKKVKSIKATDGDGKVTLVFEKNGDSFEAESAEETISISGGSWGELSSVDLKSETRADFSNKKIHFKSTYRILTDWPEKKTE